ncbi:hepatitis A virus cellular receptor 2 isoform X2 [Mesocricetus auratus]|uniref:Hepatitis A virus cellular receptor 2 isoform X2 n=1 Tax=Mesocricetus auratus TaxID=10036 RepID=A0ABM2XNW5_MESAU|nr:hepatitis A virus cellular receptor 2 isoform X2 [Mesocricetus auratus]
MFSHLTFNCVLLLLLLLLARSLEDTFIVEVGKNAYLPCNYPIPSSGIPVPVCWGRGPCPWSRCGSGVLSTDERNVTYQKSRRYQLRGSFLKGDVSLTIENVTVDDRGTYCCRVEFPGLGNDKKLDLKLDIIQAKFSPPASAHGDPATTSPRTLTTEGDGTETQTLGTLYDKNRTISTWVDDMKDSGETIRTAVYIGVGVSAGLALALIFGVLILKWYSYKKKKLQNSSLITLANLPPAGLVNAGAGRNRSEENIYTIEENIYEIQNSNEYYCYVSSGQPS